MADECVTSVKGRDVPLHSGDDTSHDCCDRSVHKTPDVPEFTPVIVNETPANAE